MTDTGSDDVAVIVYREEDDAWEADVLPTALTEDLAGLIQALRQQPSIGGTFGLVAVGDDFFVALRAVGGESLCGATFRGHGPRGHGIVRPVAEPRKPARAEVRKRLRERAFGFAPFLCRE